MRLPHLQEVAANLPLANIVIETDAAPQPFKAKRESWTEPRHLRVIAEKLASLQKKPVEEIEAITSANMKSLLGDGWKTVTKHLEQI